VTPAWRRPVWVTTPKEDLGCLEQKVSRLVSAARKTLSQILVIWSTTSRLPPKSASVATPPPPPSSSRAASERRALSTWTLVLDVTQKYSTSTRSTVVPGACGFVRDQSGWFYRVLPSLMVLCVHFWKVYRVLTGFDRV